MDTDLLWKTVLGEIELSVSKGNYVTWFKNTCLVSIDGDNVVIGVPNVFIQNQLEKRFQSLLAEIIQKNGIDNPKIMYKNLPVQQPRGVEDEDIVLPQAQRSQKPPSGSRAVAGITHSYRTGINSRYTFENFVVGGSNELAYAACRGVATSPGSKYNPLFLYGGVGIGKTHLIQAVGNEINKSNPEKQVVYISTEQFVQEFLDAIRYKKNTDFAGYYRGADVLIVDDIQFISGKEKTQEEFFHTFNALHQANKQIIMSSDRHPSDIPTLSERLQSRFGWGMAIDMYAPDLETRCAIISQKASAGGFDFSADLVEYLAGVIKNNIRELEGIINQIVAFCEMRGVEPTVDIAKALFGKLGGRPRHFSPKRIIDVVANRYSVSVEDIMSPRRDREIVFPRHLAMFLLRDELHLSFPKIALALGRKDHTTAMHSVEKISRELSLDPRLKSEVAEIRGLL
ncbi:chromosomal replication initiator DnaA [Candidatus Saccharibacteria bacterium RIFCSPHIGHO2_12_FULL_41_12]|nr:MAG: chromosomal replication initiator DnaA [Candidatus Saccharibacteria bacterium RIFCSPHIGHO2_12_FULL_41_12]